MPKTILLYIISISLLQIKLSFSSLCKICRFYLIFCIFQGYVDQTSLIYPNGSKSNTYPNISIAMSENNNIFDLTLVLIANSSPYNFSQQDFSQNLNLTLRLFFLIFSILFKH